jgi:hypothetical protein
MVNTKYLAALAQMVRKPQVPVLLQRAAPKIQDNNQAIDLGVINEESPVGVRSATKTDRKGRKRRTHGKD